MKILNDNDLKSGGSDKSKTLNILGALPWLEEGMWNRNRLCNSNPIEKIDERKLDESGGSNPWRKTKANQKKQNRWLT